MSRYDDDDSLIPPGRPILVPALVTILAFAVGTAAGTQLARWQQTTEPVVADTTAVDLDVACAPRVSETVAALDDATSAVSDLTTQVAAKQEEVKALETQIAAATNASADQRRRLAAATTELTVLRLQLASAQTDRLNLTESVHVLSSNLTDTQTHLAVQELATVRAQTDAIDASWVAFHRGAQIEICDKGTRAALGRCRESVRAHVAKLEVDYKDCLRAGAAVPTLRQANAAERLPEFSRWLGQDDRATKGWYALLCDPTLPERGASAQDGAALADGE